MGKVFVTCDIKICRQNFMLMKVLWMSRIVLFTCIGMWSAFEMHAMYDEGAIQFIIIVIVIVIAIIIIIIYSA